MKCTIFVDILLLLGVVYLLFSCNESRNIKPNDIPYSINYYVDTVESNIILVTVVNNEDNISVSTIKLN